MASNKSCDLWLSTYICWKWSLQTLLSGRRCRCTCAVIACHRALSHLSGAVGGFPGGHLLHVFCDPGTVHCDAIIVVKYESVRKVICTRAGTWRWSRRFGGRLCGRLGGRCWWRLCGCLGGRRCRCTCAVIACHRALSHLSGAVGGFPGGHLLHVFCDPGTVHCDAIIVVKNKSVRKVIRTSAGASSTSAHIERQQDRQGKERANVHHHCQ